MVSLN